jgi:hypothetical protein
MSKGGSMPVDFVSRSALTLRERRSPVIEQRHSKLARPLPGRMNLNLENPYGRT